MINFINKIYDIIHYKDGKISNTIYHELKKVNKSCYTFDDRYSHIKGILLNIYTKKNKYSIDDILTRKIYLETKLEDKNTCFTALAITFFTWEFVSIFQVF